LCSILQEHNQKETSIMTSTSTSTKKTFEANISELMNMIIHSFYSNRDVFLRELISNASDAIDKQRHTDLLNGVVDKTYGIRVDPLSRDGCLVIEDDGIGMDEEDLIRNLSTIATSGTKEFVRNLKEKSDMIGQFGVGFYSAFLVADRVDVITRKAGGPIMKWSSDADQFYTLETLDSEQQFPVNGTRIVLLLKDDAKEYLEETALRRIITRHSSFIQHPLSLYCKKTVTSDDPDVNNDANGEEDEIMEEEEEELEGKPTVVEEDIEETKDTTKPATTTTTTTQEWEKLNGGPPLWYMNASEIEGKEPYHALYKTISNDYADPLYWNHFQTEGNYEFRGILYIPSKLPYDMLGDRNREKRNIRLYVKKVLVLNELDKEMLPDWMNFVSGVIDSADLPLNVSREMLQQNKIVKALKTQLKKQVMKMLTELASCEEETYAKFYENFHRHIKLGIHEGDDSLLSFLRLKNTKTEGSITLDAYVEEHRVTEDQKSIYYITGTAPPQENAITRLYTEKGYCVLHFDEPIDEFMLQRLSKYKEYELININKDHVTPWASSTEEEEDQEQKAFFEWAKKTLDGVDSDVDSVKKSNKLVSASDPPVAVLSSKWGWTGQMEKIMQAQPLGDAKSMSYMKGKRIVELNSSHPVIKNLLDKFSTTSEEEKDEVCKERLILLYRCGLLVGGYPISNANELVNGVYSALAV
jgi:molecular chaperone HtpG